MTKNMEYKLFKDININDNFFDSLKDDYQGFEEWFKKKYDQYAYVQYDDNNNIMGFLYLKIENDIVDDVSPVIKASKILKIGTFKVIPHRTLLGERFIKIITDAAISKDVDVCYVTIFPKHTSLIDLVTRFGFVKYGSKGLLGACENVYLKDMREIKYDLHKDYPLIKTDNVKKYMLSIYPEYHTTMFPDSKLKNENLKIIKDISYTNSIHKVYVCSMKDTKQLKKGDIVVVYRTCENGKTAEYSSVATSICVVEEIKLQSDFNSFDEFYKYACKFNLFDKNRLLFLYKKGNCITIKMTYNVALKKRINRHDLIEKIGLEREKYWGFLALTESQFKQIVCEGEINENILK